MTHAAPSFRLCRWLIHSSLPVGVFSRPATILAALGFLTGSASLAQTAHYNGAAGGVNLGSVNLGDTSSSAAVSFIFDSGGELNSTTPYQVLTQGAPNLDFEDAGGSTCNGTTGYKAGNTCTVNVSLTPKFAGTRYGGVNLYDINGDVIATAYAYGAGVGPQITYAPGTQITVGSSLRTWSLAVDGNGNVYYSDIDNSDVLEVPWTGSGYGTETPVGSSLNNPEGVTVDGSGSIYIVDSGNSRVVKIPWSGSGFGAQITLLTGLNHPHGIAVDFSGNIYIADKGNDRVVILPWTGNGYGTQTTVGSGLSSPEGVAVDGNGNIYIADESNNRVVKVPWTGSGYGTQTTVGSHLNTPEDVAVDGSGNLYVADTGSSSVVKVPWMGSGYGAQTILRSGLGIPGGVAVDGKGNVYIATQYDSPILKVDLADPVALSFASTPVGKISLDGPQLEAVSNIGNAPLIFPVPVTGENPSLSPGFAWNSRATCEQTTPNSSAPFTLGEGSSCQLAIDFKPTVPDITSGGVILTDNNLNASPSGIQTIPLSGIATAGPGPASRLTASAPGTATAGAPFEVTVIAKDANGYTATGYGGTVALSSTDNNAVLPANGTLTNGTGKFTVTLRTAGKQTVTATDTSTATLTAATAPIAVSALTVASHLAISYPASTFMGMPYTGTVTAEDAFGNTVAGFTGIVTITTSDGAATVTPPVVMTAGVGTFMVMFDTAGIQNITAQAPGVTSATDTGIVVETPSAFVVTTALDVTDPTPDCTSGTGTTCSLRDALAAAATAGAGRITFSATVFTSANTTAQNTITLTGGGLSLPPNTSVIGPTSGNGSSATNLVTISGNKLYAVFTVGREFGASLTSLMITSGYGGGINNNGTLMVTNSLISNSHAIEAAGINNGTWLTVRDSTFSDNSTFPDNFDEGTPDPCAGPGGAIGNGGTLVVSGSTFLDNCASNGGAIENYGLAEITNSTVYSNTAFMGNGGGIDNEGTLIVDNSTFDTNDSDQYDFDTGGGISNSGTLTVTNSIFHDNYSSVGGTAIENAGTANVSDTVFYGNKSGYGKDDCDSCTTDRNAIDADPMLTSLEGHGGTTQTFLPLPGSAAICAGSVSLVPAGLTTDQRGYPRITTYGSATCVDAGAVETNYQSVQFTNIPASGYYSGVTYAAIAHAPVVSVTESGHNTGKVPITLSFSGAGTATGLGPVTTVGGVGATFPDIEVDAPGASDTLSVSLPLTAPRNAVQLPPLAATVALQIVAPSVRQVVVGTAPAGLAFIVDGTTYTSTQTLSWTIGSQHTLSTTAGQTGTGGHYAFAGWSDGTASVTDKVTFAASTRTYTADFSASYELALSANPLTDGTVAPATGTYYPVGTVVSLMATPNAVTVFSGWTGSADIASPSSSSTTITMNGPETVVADFTPTPSFVVTSVADSTAAPAANCPRGGPSGSSGMNCTLREALAAAGAANGGNITFSPAVFNASNTPDENTISLEGDSVAVPTKTTITGPTTGSGASLTNLVAISGRRAHRLGVIVVQRGVGQVLANLIVEDGAAAFNAATSDLPSGAGLANYGSLTVSNCTFTENAALSADGIGGTGGAIYNSAKLTIIGSTISGNSADGGSSSSPGSGGGISNGGRLTIINSTITKNSASGLANGGGIFNSGTLTVSNSTISRNSSSSSAGGIDNVGTLTVTNSILTGDENGECSGTECPTSGNNGNVVEATNLDLAPLGNYGGPTQTEIPLPGSAAICAGSASLLPAEMITDQRGLPNMNSTYSGYTSTARCADAGSVQTNYSLSFTTEVSSTAQSVAMNPPPAVTLDESNIQFTAAVVTIPLTLNGGGATLKGGSAATTSGVATYRGLSVNAIGMGYALNANLALNAAANPSPVASTTSSTFNVNPAGPPVGSLGSAVDSVTGSTIVGASDSLKLVGWVADLVDGAPLSNVKVYIDGTLAGTPSLGIARPEVAVVDHNAAWLNSGFQFLDAVSSLALGAHTVTVVAIDSGGRSTTLGPLSFTVAAIAGASPPFGSLGSVADSVTGSMTVSQSDSVDIKGWVADPLDSAPLSNVSVSLDGTPAGTPTLGLARTDVAATYGDADLDSGYELQYSAGSLSPGKHRVTVTATDSGGRSTIFGPVYFTVAATAGAGPPFGGIGFVGDSTTLRTTVSPSDSLEVRGWVADQTDGAPLSNVQVYIDVATAAGTPTLGLKRTDVATKDGQKYLNSGYQLLYPASSLAVGSHFVTVVATDSGGRTTTFGPVTFIVQ